MPSELRDVIFSHYQLSSLSMQNCVKYCTPEERSAVFEELRPHCLFLAKDKYAHHIVIKMLDSGTFLNWDQQIVSDVLSKSVIFLPSCSRIWVLSLFLQTYLVHYFQGIPMLKL